MDKQNRMGVRLYKKISDLLKCLLEVLFPEPASCSSCGRVGKLTDKYRLCGKCREGLTPFAGLDGMQEEGIAYDSCIAVFNYEGTARDMIHRLKYKDKRNIAITIGTFLAERMENQWNEIDLIVPVPVSRKKRSSRGYNHALLIAEELSKLSGVSLDRCLERIKDTKPQVLFNINERWYNVKGCFTCVQNLDNKRILLIDDVVTTGATAHNCAEAIKACGAKSVTVLAFAKSIMK